MTALPSICRKRQQGGVMFAPLGPAVKGGWSVSLYLAELPALVCGCVTFIANLLTAQIVTSLPHLFLELHTSTSGKEKYLNHK